MRFDTKPHQFSGGIDLPARSMYVCLLNQDGDIVVHRTLQTKPDALLQILAPSREDSVVAVDCLFTWYGLAALCAQEGIPCVLGHALYLKAIPGGKAQNEKIDAPKIAVLRRGGMRPQASVSPAERRATRDLRRRRRSLMRQRAALLTPVPQPNSQDTLPESGKNIAYQANREGGQNDSLLPRSRKASPGSLHDSETTTAGSPRSSSAW